MFFRKCSVLLFLFTFALCGAQKKFVQGNSPPANAMDAEKIYLQLTGKAYNTSEIIWFKTIVANAFDNSLSPISGVLHVELIEPIDQRIVDSKLLKLENGITESFFQLHANYDEGKYQIRAYTEWNKNFGSDFMFSTYVDIFHFKRLEDRPDPIRDVTITKKPDDETRTISSKVFPYEIDSLHNGKAIVYLNWKTGKDSIEINIKKKDNSGYFEHNAPVNVQTISYRLKTKQKSYTKTIVLDENDGSLVFFPEGGELVNGLQSRVGFKYLDYQGKGAEVEGIVVDQLDNEIGTFKSNQIGMGSIELRPESGKRYFGIVGTKNENTHRYPLPAAKSQGITMRVIDRKSMKLFTLEAQPRITDSIFIKLYHRGKDIYMLRALMKKGKFNYVFKSRVLPNGLVGATLYNSRHQPIAERHFYNHRPSENLNVAIEIDRNEYEPRDSTVVRINTRRGTKPVSAFLSLMAINKPYFEKTNLNENNILSYLLLESDIRGEIENPAFYFEDEAHLGDLDYLMLTQGWTNYKYDRPQKPKIFPPERGLSLSGTVGGVQNLKQRKRFQDEKFDLVLMTFGENTDVYQPEIDRTGFFDFKLQDSYGEGTKFVIQPASSERRNATFKVNIKEREIPEINYRVEEVIAPVDTVIQEAVIDRIERDISLDPYLLPNTIELEGVEVSDYFLTPEREEMKKLHGLPDVVIDNRELLAKEKNWTGRLYSWLMFNYPQELDVRRVGRSPSFLYANAHGAEFTYVLVDGIPIMIENYSIVPDIPLEAVKSVEILSNASSANRYFCDVFPLACSSQPPPFPAILAIYTYSGKGLFGAFPKKTNLLQASAPEFSPKREFYSPVYDTANENDGAPDLRTLIHWEPNISTDSEGNTTIKYFNGDITGEVLIICESIEPAGSIGRSEISYDIID